MLTLEQTMEKAQEALEMGIENPSHAHEYTKVAEGYLALGQRIFEIFYEVVEPRQPLHVVD